MLYLLLPSSIFRSLQPFFRPCAGESPLSLAALHGFHLALSVSLFANCLNFARTTPVTLYGHPRPTPLESALAKNMPITPSRSTVPKTQDVKPLRICTYKKIGGRGA